MQINKYENVSVSQAESFEYRTESWRHCLVVKPLIQSELLFTGRTRREGMYRFLTRPEHRTCWFHSYSARLICLEYGPQFSNDAAMRVRVRRYLWDQSVTHIGEDRSINCRLLRQLQSESVNPWDFTNEKVLAVLHRSSDLISNNL